MLLVASFLLLPLLQEGGDHARGGFPASFSPSSLPTHLSNSFLFGPFSRPHLQKSIAVVAGLVHSPSFFLLPSQKYLWDVETLHPWIWFYCAHDRHTLLVKNFENDSGLRYFVLRRLFPTEPAGKLAVASPKQKSKILNVLPTEHEVIPNQKSEDCLQ